MNDPKYIGMVMLDDPKLFPGTNGLQPSGWNAVPAAANIIERIAPMLCVQPVFSGEEMRKLARARSKSE